MDSNLYITPAKQFGQTLEASAQIEDKGPGIVLLEVGGEKIQQKRFPGGRAAKKQGVRAVAVMEVQKVRRVVVRFQDRERLLLEMAVLRLAAVEGKEKGIVRVVRAQEIEGAEIPGVIAGNGRKKCVQKVVFLFIELRVVDAKDLVELRRRAIHFPDVEIVNDHAERKLAKVVPF